MRVCICDDQKEDRDTLKALMNRYISGRGITAEISEAESAEELFVKYADELNGLDILFLDIFMDGMSGMDAAKKIRETGCDVKLVFLTTSSDYAVESYDVGAAGYLLKPPDVQKFGQLMKRLSGKQREQLIITNGSEVQSVNFDDITFIESSGHQSIIHITGTDSARCWKKLDELEEQLESDGRFLRCAQSFIVNMDRVCSMKDMMIMDDGTEIPVSRRKKKEVREGYFRYIISTAGRGE